ncbi:uncharacterized protein N7498_004028 [Penicillium cinerascens]|uniref:Period circadian protein n=1 Tax=Penicillium cinerascens TaxID=70096 RepID=A0A9W9N390_9EURO|nr:uncharacterized protein N7498_004028 [Penicillium cinerascens]KAJ5212382.1 hypothetical protein N7498_004028 [Penicillium cinerascens]
MSGIINKVKDAVAHHGDKSNDNEHHQTGTSHNSNAYDYGPHSSNVANAADPRVDSDRSAHNTSSTGHSTAQPHSATGMTGAGTTGAGTAGTGMAGAGTTGASHNAYDSSRSSNYGPHGSNIANTADPRVDSDRSSHAAYNTTSTGPTSTLASGTGHNTSTHNSSAPLATGAGAGMAGTAMGGPGIAGAGMAGPHQDINDSSRSSNYGPHNSNVANAADPRIDSDRSAHHTSTTPAHHTSTTHHSGAPVAASAGMAGAGVAAAQHDSHRSSNYAPYDSNVANTADPRIDSHHASTGGVSNPSTDSYATGPASSTAGPHTSNLANKADPRVNSDLSKQNTHSSVGNAGVMPISGGSDNTTTKTFEQAQETSGAAGSSYNHPGSTHHKSTAGPHDSSVGNKVDPRVDSDLDNSATLGSQRI